ncbi:hypothetical protein [Pseudomonas gingeri]|nr:hypothetical protein [Pseudomonas gingeri]
MPSMVFAGLNIVTATVSPGDVNFMPSAWPPAPDFPICISAEGEITARYGDNEWDLTPWAGFVLKLNFGESKRKNFGNISPENSEIFKRIIAFWIYGPNPCREIRTLQSQYENLRQVFTHCTKNNIVASDLYRFPKVIESFSKVIWPSQAGRLIVLLHTLWERREHSGVYILDDKGIAELQSKIPVHEKSQTAYIPPRIWLYQLSRLRDFLEDFRSNLDALEACAEYCLQAYAISAGSVEAACSLLTKHNRPFISVNNPTRNDKLSGAHGFGPFYITAENFGISDLLEKWCGDVRHNGVTILSQYFSMATQIGKAYLLNFTLMRIDETSSLRSDCLVIEKDKITKEDIYLLRASTSKTVEDDEACWITSPSSKVAIEVMNSVSKFRTRCASFNSEISLTEEDRQNPFLELRAYEPWRRSTRFDTTPDVRRNELHYGMFPTRYPRLFDEGELQIQEGDLMGALLITPTLSPAKYAVGKTWPLAWHQLRRTGAVNMSASGIVSDPSVQYQLKHASRAMTRYYGNGYYHLNANLNQEAQAEYIRAMYESVARSFSALNTSTFVSPHGEKRKDQILHLVSVNDHIKLVKAAKSGAIGYREILLGACANPTPCPYGGIDYVGRCGGGDGKPACLDLLIDKGKKQQILKLRDILQKRLRDADEGSPLHTSIKYQLQAIESVLDAIKNS